MANSFIIRQIIKGVKSHTDHSAGISNVLINRFARSLCSRDFQGVYSADTIPEIMLTNRPRFIIIVNLGERKGYDSNIPVGHFVCICADTSRIQYIDPYGLPCIQPKVLNFLKHCHRPIIMNKRQIQDLSSVYCGFFALLFAMYMDRGLSVEKPKFRLKFHKRKRELKKNDVLCISYIRKLIL